MLAAHPLADVLPLLSGIALADLMADIAANGLRQPITLLDGAVLDGRSRLFACVAAGITPRFADFTGFDPAGFVVASNVWQRNLNVSQRAMTAARLAKLAHNGSQSSNQAVSSWLEYAAPPRMTIVRAADLLNVSLSTVKGARVVIVYGTPELAGLVEAGVISISTAVDVSRLPADVQRVVCEDPASILIVARAIRTRASVALTALQRSVCSPVTETVEHLLKQGLKREGSGISVQLDPSRIYDCLPVAGHHADRRCTGFRS